MLPQFPAHVTHAFVRKSERNAFGTKCGCVFNYRHSFFTALGTPLLNTSHFIDARFKVFSQGSSTTQRTV